MGPRSVTSAGGIEGQCLPKVPQECMSIFSTRVTLGRVARGQMFCPCAVTFQPISLQFPEGDPKLKTQGKCMPFFRAGFVCPTSPYQSLAREQINALTSFMDASMVYGSEPSLANRLRNLSSPLGLLAVNEEVSDHGLPLLPFVSVKPSPCEVINKTAGVPCFLAGESSLEKKKKSKGLRGKGIIQGSCSISASFQENTQASTICSTPQAICTTELGVEKGPDEERI